MYSAQHRVWKFLDKTQGYIAAEPGIPPDEIKQLNIRLILEEFRELMEAMEADDLVETADGIADLIFVAIHAAVQYGIPLTQIWSEVCDNNDLKWANGVIRDAGGKIQKPADWQPPNIEGILNAAIQDYQRRRDTDSAESPAAIVRSRTHKHPGAGYEEAPRTAESGSSPGRREDAGHGGVPDSGDQVPKNNREVDDPPGT